MAYRGSRPIAVWIIIALNLLLYIVISVNPKFFVELLGFQPASFLASPWTIVTNLFVHAPFPQIWHILANMITLYFFGSFLCRLIGVKRFLLVYFIGGIVGNIFFILLPPSPFSIAIGASGAVFALAGVLVVMMPKLRVLLYFIFPLPLWVVVLVFFVIWSFLLGVVWQAHSGIAWQAHLGGLALGMVAGYIFRRRARHSYT